jgi:hypothetical protein
MTKTILRQRCNLLIFFTGYYYYHECFSDNKAKKMINKPAPEINFIERSHESHKENGHERGRRESGRVRGRRGRSREEAEFCSLQACLPQLAEAGRAASRLDILLEAINYIGTTIYRNKKF